MASLCLMAWSGCSCEDSEPAPVRAGQQEERQEGEEPEAAAPESAEEPAQKEKRTIGDNLLQAPADYLRTTTIQAPRHARKTVDVAYVQNEIYQWEAIHGRFPKSLDELVEWRGAPLPEVPNGHKYTYDPETGKVDVVPVESAAQ
jgi:hypothetical protein